MIWVLVVAFLASTGLTGLVRIYALKRNLLDHPNSRSSHLVATPRGGGLAIVLVYLGVTLLLGERLVLGDFLGLFIGGGLVAGIGYWDDHRDLAVRWRILAHSAAAAWAVIWLGGFPPLQIGPWQLALGWFGYPLGVLFLVWLLNLYNFMDGIDGIAGSEAIAVSSGACLIGLGLGIEQGTTGQMLLLSLGAASLGFLLWNWPPAKIFMGDVGSGFLGFVLGLLALSTAISGALPLWSWLILLAVFLVDATVTLLRRFLRGARWYQAHRSHAYQHAARRWGSHGRVTLGVIAIDLIWLWPLAWLAALFPQQGWLITLLAVTPLLVLALRLDAGVDS